MFSPDAWFKFESDDIKNKIMNAYNNPGNCGISEQMKNFEPVEKIL